MNKKFLALLILILAIITTHGAVYGNADLNSEYDYLEDQKIYSTATLSDNFSDNRVVVVLTLKASRETINNRRPLFSGIGRYSIECITPGLESATDQITNYTTYVKTRDSINLMQFRRIFILTLFQPGKQNVLNAIKELETRSDVRSASPDFHNEISGSNIENFSVSSETHWWQKNIGLSLAHQITKGSSDILVGIIDTGIDKAHPSLIGQIDEQLSVNFVDDGKTPWRDEFNRGDGHGTPIAGIIAGLGGYGIAPNVRLVSLRTGTTSHRDRDILAAIKHATDNPAIKILNISLSVYRRDSSILDAISIFPGLVVGSAGNGNYDNNKAYPKTNINESTRPKNLIIVGAMTSANEKWDKSNWGNQTVDLFAPGEDITAFKPGGGTKQYSATSFATPMVTGVAALMMSLDPNIRGDSLRHAINDNVNRVVGSSISFLYSITGGRLSAIDALENTPVTILQNQWGFQPQYFFDSREVMHEFRDLKITTNRLRTGFIEEEFVVLSSNRANAGLAYLELHFNRPIRRLEIDMALWSGIEGFGTNADLKIEYLDWQYGWQDKIDLLSDISLPTTRSRPLRQSIIFTDDVFAIRVINRHNNPNGVQNRGRLCIGAMTIHTRREW